MKQAKPFSKLQYFDSYTPNCKFSPIQFKCYFFFLVFVLGSLSSYAQVPVPGNFYNIITKTNQEALDVQGGVYSTQDGVPILRYQLNGNDNQLFSLKDNGGGYYKIIAKHSGKALDVTSGTSESKKGDPITQWTIQEDDDGQLFHIDDPDGDGYYQIVSKLYSDRVLDLKSSGVELIQWTSNNGDNQLFRFEQVNAEALSIENRIKEVLPYSNSVFNIVTTCSGANCTLSGTVKWTNDVTINLSGPVTIDGETVNSEITGTIENVTIDELLKAMGVSTRMRDDLPGSFKQSRINSISLKINTDRQLTASLATNLGEMGISGNKENGFMMGITPTDLSGLTGITSVNNILEGFTFIFSSYADKKESSLDLLPDVSVENGLNSYWTGKLPSVLIDFLSFIPGIEDEMTFSGSGSLESGAALPELSISIPGTHDKNPISFGDLRFVLNPGNAEMRLDGQITCSFGGGVPVLGFQPSLKASFSTPPTLTAEMRLNKVNGVVSYAWENPFGIPYIIINELYVGVEAQKTGVGGYLGGQGQFGSTANKITMGLEIGSGPSFMGSADRLSIPAFYKAFSSADMGVFEDILNVEISDAIINVNTTSKEIHFAGEGNIFGLHTDFDVKSKDGKFSMEGQMDPLVISSHGTIIFGMTGGTVSPGPLLSLNKDFNGTIAGNIVLLGKEQASTFITITPDKIEYNAEQDLFTSNLKANLKVIATDFLNLNNANYQLEATITNNLCTQIVGKIKQDLSSIDPINFTGNVVNEALKTFEIKNIGFNTALNGFNKASVNVTVDARLAGKAIPVNVTLNLSASAIEDLATGVANEIVKELEKAGSILMKEIEDVAKVAFMVSKETIDWTEGAANETYKGFEGTFSAAGKFLGGAGNSIASWFGGGKSHNYDCSKVAFTPPSNGVSSGLAPKGIDQYRITLHSIRTIKTGHEGNNKLEVWGSVLIKTNMAMQRNANIFLYNQSCRDATDCPLNTTVNIYKYKDFFISSDLVSTVNFDIDLVLFEEDGNKDETFEIQTLNIAYRNGMGFPLSPGQKRFHSLIIEEDHGNPAKIKVELSIERIMEPPVNASFVNIHPIDQTDVLNTTLNGEVSLSSHDDGSNRQRWEFVRRLDGYYNIKIRGGTNPGKTFLSGTSSGNVVLTSEDDKSGRQQWEVIKSLNGGYNIKIKGGINDPEKVYLIRSNAGGVILQRFETSFYNGRWILTPFDLNGQELIPSKELIGIGTDNKLYTRATLNSIWVEVPNSGDVKAVTQMHDGTILGVGMNNQLYTRATLNSSWANVPNSGGVKAVTQMHDGTILGVRMNNQLCTRATLNSSWANVPNSGDVKAVTQMHDGTILGVRMNNQLYSRATLNSSWVNVPNSMPVIAVTQMHDGSIIGVSTSNILFIRPTLNEDWAMMGLFYQKKVIGITTDGAP